MFRPNFARFEEPGFKEALAKIILSIDTKLPKEYRIRKMEAVTSEGDREMVVVNVEGRILGMLLPGDFTVTAIRTTYMDDSTTLTKFEPHRCGGMVPFEIEIVL